jgi:hypothetical protein
MPGAEYFSMMTTGENPVHGHRGKCFGHGGEKPGRSIRAGGAGVIRFPMFLGEGRSSVPRTGVDGR